MEHALVVLLVTTVLVGASAPSLLRAVLAPSPGGGVLITSMAYLVGIAIVAIRGGDDTAYLVFGICAIFTSAFLCGYFATGRSMGPVAGAAGGKPSGPPDGQQRAALKWVAFLGIAGIVLIAVYLTGTDRLLAALYKFVMFGDTDVSVLDLRLGFSAGEERYLAPGYVKQFRDVLLPLCALLVLFTIRRSRRRFYLIALTVIPLVVALMISSGERGPVMLFLIGVVNAAFLAVRMGVIDRKTVLVPILFVGLAGGGAFAALTSSFTSREYDDMPFIVIFADRSVTRAPEENVQSSVIWRKGAPYPGEGWISELGTIVPGRGRQLTLSMLAAQMLYGGDTGNSVLGMWVDVFYNFGWILGIPVAWLIGAFFARFNRWVTLRRMRSPASAVCGLWLSVTMLMVLSPYGLLLYGPFVLTIILLLISRAPARTAQSTGLPGLVLNHD